MGHVHRCSEATSVMCKPHHWIVCVLRQCSRPSSGRIQQINMKKTIASMHLSRCTVQKPMLAVPGLWAFQDPVRHDGDESNAISYLAVKKQKVFIRVICLKGTSRIDRAPFAAVVGAMYFTPYSWLCISLFLLSLSTIRRTLL